MNFIWWHKLSSPKYFYRLSAILLPWLSILFLLSMAYGLIGGLYLAPPDYQQGDAFRIIYVHVPSAMMSMMIYTFMAVAALVAYVWQIKMADMAIKVAAPLGAMFTFLALVTGAIWGKPMWGTWWVWDARLTSELILLFIYFGLIGLESAISDKNMAAKAVRMMTLIGFVNIPIIHYSVNWWQTLHQGDTLNLFGHSLIAPSMLHPLLAMMFAFTLYFSIMMMLGLRSEILHREKNANWLRELKGMTS